MRTTGTLRGLALACHPGPTVVVTAIAAALAAGVGGTPGQTGRVAAAVLAGQLSIGWSNDWVDAARDRAVAREDKPVVRGLVSVDALRAAASWAAAACVLLSALLGAAAGGLHLLAVAGGWSYNVRLKRTVWSGAPFALSFGLLPVLVVLATGQRPAVWVAAAGALLGVGAHVANVLPDLEDDARTGVRGLAHRLGRTRAGVAAPALLGAAVAVVVLAPPGQPRPAVAAAGLVAVATGVAAGVVALRRHRSRLPFTLSMVVAALCVGLLVTAAPALVA